MKAKRLNKPHFAFPVIIISSLCLQTSAIPTDYPRVMNETWNHITQIPNGSQNTTEANTKSSLSINFGSQTTTFEMQPSTVQPLPCTKAQNSTSSPASSAVPATGAGSTRKPKSTTTKETCEDNKSLILICFIVIAILVLICTFLFLSTVIIANKMSYLKKTQQGKRRARSNGDILATNSLWPTAAGTWQKMLKDTTGSDVIMQDLVSGRDAMIQRKTQDETTEKLTKETDNQQENKESSKSQKPILTNFVVEI
ncbi:PREDICTED: protein EVI2A [Apaloderma vittatum]|uniref:Protein EVI2A n=1 Tax=Apaloderma vittatum TaxID=57397 RepID=A0A091MVA3_APAVI|nr:PREDICTED: protein EVI2A [Apaloderma vittatum]KFP80627.1 Protein EVI2A [Apaloderma vittatum]